jgi:aminopeptidase N
MREGGTSGPVRGAVRAGLALLLAVTGPLASADVYPRQPGLDVVHYAFRLTLSDETDAITGEATIEVQVRSDGVSALALDLAQPKPNAPERGMSVDDVAEAGASLRYEHANDRLLIHFARPARRGETHEIVVRYHGVPATGLLIAPNKYGERCFFSDNWPDKARQWLPVVDHPYDKATSELYVTAPSHYQVVSNGLLVEETDLGDGRRLTHWRQSVPIAAWLYGLGVARFAVDHRPFWQGRPIETWVFRQDRDTGFAAFAEPTTDVLDFFASRIGPYSYERLANVEANGVNGGMELATSIFYGPESASGQKPLRWRNVVVHEIAHQWFGDSVTESDWDDVWLSEGFATYFTLLFVEHAYGHDEFLAGLRADRDAIREFDEKNPDYRVVHDNLSDMSKVLSSVGTYKKGSWTLHMLRGVIGDEAFWTGIRTYYRRYQNENASTSDLRRAMEDASGRDLEWFFDEWLTRGGMLKVQARWTWDAAKSQVRLEVAQRQAGPPYRMPVEVAIETEGQPEPRVEHVELRNASDRFTFAVDREPRSLVLDPRTFVLMDAETTRADVIPAAFRPPSAGRRTREVSR